MHRLLKILIFAFILTLCTNVEESYAQTWAKEYIPYPAPSYGYIYFHHALTLDKCYILAGEINQSIPYIWVLKINQAGDIVWQEAITNDKGFSQVDYIYSTSDEGYLIAAQTKPNNLACIIKLDGSGNIIWKKEMQNCQDCSENINSIIPASDGGYILAGFNYINTNNWIGRGEWLAKINESCDIIWQKMYYNSDYQWSETMNSIAPAPDGGYIAGGLLVAYLNPAQYDFQAGACIMKLDNKGNRIWQRIYGGLVEEDWEEADFIFANKDGSYSLIGNWDWGEWAQTWILKFDKNGNSLWQKKYYQDQYTGFQLKSAYPTDDQGYILTGDIGILSSKIFIMKIDKNGSITWQKTFATNDSINDVSSISPAYDGGYLVIINSQNNEYNNGKLIILKVDNQGNIGSSCQYISSSSAKMHSADISASKIDMPPKNASVAAANFQATISEASADIQLLCSNNDYFNMECQPFTLLRTSKCKINSHGFAGAINLGCSGLPAGLSCQFSPDPVMLIANSSEDSILTVKKTSGVLPGIYPFIVTASAGFLNYQLELQIKILDHSQTKGPHELN